MTPIDALRRRIATLRGRLPRLRRPAYTGENRCWPCTALNAAVVVAVAALLSLYSVPLGVLALAGGTLLVAFRGYVVPGTPRFAPKLFAPLPVEFGHGGDGPSGTLGGEAGPETDPGVLVETLVEGGVIETEGGELYLEESFRAVWEDRLATLRDASDDDLASRAAAAAGGDAEARFHGDRLLVAGDRDAWLSRAVAIAETAAVETLAEWDIPEGVRPPAAQPLRTFVETCPACGGRVRETTLQNCCGGSGSVYKNPERAALVCADCEAVVFVFDDASA